MRQSEREWAVFTERFKSSRRAVFKVAEYIWREKGLGVTIPSMELAPSIHQSADYVDKGDIICHTARGNEFIIEVKGVSTEFTCAEDFPFKTMIVNEVVKADRIDAFAYFIVNKALTHAFVLKTDTKDQWGIKDVHDKRRGDTEEMYYCELSCGEFVEL